MIRRPVNRFDRIINKPYPRPKELTQGRKTLTLCISAACWRSEGKTAIVLCSDKRLETYTTGADIEDKVSLLIPRWATLISASNFSRAEELIDAYREYFRKAKITHRNALVEFKKPALQQRRNILDERSRRIVGISYNDLIATGRTRLGDSIFTDKIKEVSEEKLGCQLIISGFIDQECHIFVVEEDASVWFLEHFAAIGAGSTLADAFLFHRKQRETLSLEKTIYHLYEARRFAKSAPGVGRKETNIDVMIPNKKSGYKIFSLRPEVVKLLDKAFGKFGPRKIEEKIGLGKKFLRKFYY